MIIFSKVYFILVSSEFGADVIYEHCNLVILWTGICLLRLLNETPPLPFIRVAIIR
jgi:hypothetical protein